MKQKWLAIILAGLTAAYGISSVPIAAETSTDSYSMNLSVRLSGEKKEISPYIYGVNEYGDSKGLKTVTAGSIRQGGNRYTGYNWENNYSNAGSDWLYSSDTNIGDITDGAGYAGRRLSEAAQNNQIPYKLATLQMAGYVAADKNGTVSEEEVAPSDRWNRVEFRKNDTFSLEPDLDDGTVYMDEYVNFLVQTLGDSATETGIQGYHLDNEPVLWQNTHSRLHPEAVTNAELIGNSIELAKAVKDVDPNAEIFGPAFWGMLPCIQGCGSNETTDPDWEAVKDQYDWYMEYYLTQMADAEKEDGRRLLDVFDVHYYSQDCETDEAKLQAARSLYDPDYHENSWLQPWYKDYFPFLTRLQESIEKYYPGTKLSLSEYSLVNISDTQAGTSVVSALTEAETLGAFADQGVYMANYWGSLSDAPYVASAINLYTNYDGNGSSFGDTLVESESEDLSRSAVFASIDGTDVSTVKTVLSNKSMTETEKATITIEGGLDSYQSAVVYGLTENSTDIKILDIQNDLSGNQVTVELPPLSVVQIVISDEKTDVVIPEEPNIQEEQIVYSYDELEISENGYPMIPLGDKDHLKKILINTTVTSSEGASWGCGGGALCFNHVIPEGKDTGVWGNKSFGYNLGTADNVIIFDDQYTIVEDEKSVEVTASIEDTYAELQNWWASSDKQEDGSDLTCTFHTITLIYEYPAEETPQETTETTVTTENLLTTETTTTTSSAAGETTVVSESTSVEDTTVFLPEQSETQTEATTEEKIEATIYGDINLDGRVDITDAVLLNKAVAMQVKLNAHAEQNGDCNADGTVESTDALILLRFLVRIIDKLPFSES